MSKKSFWTNYHSHSHYCDGVESPRAQVQAALTQGVHSFGFSSHSPVHFENAWSMKASKMNDYLTETRALQAEIAARIELYVGMEIDYLPGHSGPATFASELDFTIGSVHYLDDNEKNEPWEIDGSTEKFIVGLTEVHGGDIQKVIKLYYGRIREMLLQDPPDILGHIDKIMIHNVRNCLYEETDKWYQEEIEDTLNVLAKTNTILEVNTRGLYKKNLSTYPSLPILQKALQRNIPIMINSDSHAPSEITSRFSRTALQLKQLGFRTLRILWEGQWEDVAFDEEGLYL